MSSPLACRVQYREQHGISAVTNDFHNLEPRPRLEDFQAGKTSQQPRSQGYTRTLADSAFRTSSEGRPAHSSSTWRRSGLNYGRRSGMRSAGQMLLNESSPSGWVPLHSVAHFDLSWPCFRHAVCFLLAVDPCICLALSHSHSHSLLQGPISWMRLS